MTASPQGSQDERRSRRSRWVAIVIAAAVVLGVLALALAIGYIFFRPAGPPAVGTEAPVIPESRWSGPVTFALSLLLG